MCTEAPLPCDLFWYGEPGDTLDLERLATRNLIRCGGNAPGP